MKVVGAVLAGGRSARMGRDKAGVVVDGDTLGARAVSVLRDVCDDVVVLGHGRSMPADVERIEDALVDAGPAGGLLALLRSERADKYVVVAVDMPNVLAAHVRRLLAENARAACFTLDDDIEPLPLAIDARARVVVEEAVARGQRSLRGIVNAIGPALIALEENERDVVHNVNTPHDLAR